MVAALKQKLKRDEFIITAELCPPKGPDVSSFVSKARLIKGLVDAVNITDNQRAMMRMSSLACAKLVQEEGIEPVLQITCRDRNRIAIQSDLLGASAFGIHNVLAITGDYVTEGDNPEAKPVFDIDSALLIKTISGMNNGIELSGKNLNGKTNFFIGAAVNPCAEPTEPHRMAFEKKILCGAQFFQTQAIFDMKKFSQFMDYAKHFPVKILGGILLVKSLKMAQFLNDHVPGVHVPKDLMTRLEKSKDPILTGVEIAREQIEHLRKICHGVHIMTVGNEERIADILSK
jgi:5,10-methylenetetrahydrofolate reductase